MFNLWVVPVLARLESYNGGILKHLNMGDHKISHFDIFATKGNAYLMSFSTKTFNQFSNFFQVSGGI